MAKQYYILLLDDRFDLRQIDNILLDNYQAVFFLFWISPSTKAQLESMNGASFFGLQDLISNEMAWGEEAYKIAREVIDSGPHYGDLPLQNYLAEPLYKESHLPCLLDKVIELAGRLRDQEGCEQVVLEGQLKKTHGDLLGRKLFYRHGYLFKEFLPREKPVSSFTNNSETTSSNRLNQLLKIWSRNDWLTHVMHLLERTDKTYRYRCSLGPLFPRSAIAKGGITFFSSYLNNSRILSSLIGLMPSPITWIVTNVWARRGIMDSRGKAFWLWQFSGDLPPRFQGRDTLRPVKFSEDSPDYLYLASTETWKNWEQIESPLLMNLTKAWEAYLNEAEPRLIVMANQWGIEGWFTRCAKRKGIPVLQVMHGVLGGYLFTRTPIISDALIVPGEFWKNLWADDQKDKILVYNPPDSFPQRERSHKSRPTTITYFSWPLPIIPFYNFSEIADTIIRILHHLVSSQDIQIKIRPHPLENLHDFLGRWCYLCGPLPGNVTIDGNNSLQETLEQTDLALMFRSTVMLNCLAQRIPVIMPGWVDYGWNAGLAEIPGVYLARDFIDLEERILLWLQHPPDWPEATAKKLVRPPGEGEDRFQLVIEKLLNEKCL